MVGQNGGSSHELDSGQCISMVPSQMTDLGVPTRVVVVHVGIWPLHYLGMAFILTLTLTFWPNT